MIESWVHWRLISDPRTAVWFGLRVTPVIGEEDPERDAAGNVLPFAVFRLSSSQKETTLDLGTSAGQSAVVVDVWAPTYDAAKAAARAVAAVLDRATTSGYGAKVHVCLDDGENDDAGIPVNGKDKPLYLVSKTFRILDEN
jgi:hypothetical protein